MWVWTYTCGHLVPGLRQELPATIVWASESMRTTSTWAVPGASVSLAGLGEGAAWQTLQIVERLQVR